MYASRNITNCTKDCLCLFVCPTGATDTENGQIDKDRCLDGCRLCVDTCPSHAIYLVMENYPEKKPKPPELADMMLTLYERKCEQERVAESLGANSKNSGETKLAKALQSSCRIVAEDCAREGGYMLPQGPQATELLEDLLPDADPEVHEIIRKLLQQLY